MVLESLITPIQAEKRPWQMFFLGILFALVGIGFSLWVFEGQSSLVMVFLIVMACIPIVYNTLLLEEQKDEEDLSEMHLLGEHAKALSGFMFLFLGITVTCAAVYVFVPEVYIDSLFAVQSQAITDVNNRVAGNVVSPEALPLIFLNNLKVLIFCIIFAFVYGVGAIFILVWNASVIGVALGDFIRGRVSEAASTLGQAGMAQYFQAFSLGVIRYSTHGAFEILAYFVAGFAGGIISLSVVRHNFGTPVFDKTLLDSAGLLMISLFLLFFAAIIEVYITPLFFI